MSILGLAGYALACVAWLVLAGLLGTALRQDQTGNARRLLIAAGVSALWALALALASAGFHIPAWLVVAMELLRDAAWLNALLAIAPRVLPRFLVPVAWSIFGLWVLACLVVRPLEAVVAGGGFTFSVLVL